MSTAAARGVPIAIITELIRRIRRHLRGWLGRLSSWSKVLVQAVFIIRFCSDGVWLKHHHDLFGKIEGPFRPDIITGSEATGTLSCCSSPQLENAEEAFEVGVVQRIRWRLPQGRLEGKLHACGDMEQSLFAGTLLQSASRPKGKE